MISRSALVALLIGDGSDAIGFGFFVLLMLPLYAPAFVLTVVVVRRGLRRTMNRWLTLAVCATIVVLTACVPVLLLDKSAIDLDDIKGALISSALPALLPLSWLLYRDRRVLMTTRALLAERLARAGFQSQSAAGEVVQRYVREQPPTRVSVTIFMDMRCEISVGAETASALWTTLGSIGFPAH